MSLLKSNQKQKVRFQKGDFILYEPTKEKKEVILNEIKENAKIDSGLNVEVELTMKNVRTIIKEITNIGEEIDEYNNDELAELIDGGNRDLTLFMREIEKYITELIEDIQYEQFKVIQMGDSLVKTLEGVQETEKVKTKLNTLLKKNGITATLDEINEAKDNPEKLEKLLTPKAKGKGKKKTSPKKK